MLKDTTLPSFWFFKLKLTCFHSWTDLIWFKANWTLVLTCPSLPCFLVLQVRITGCTMLKSRSAGQIQCRNWDFLSVTSRQPWCGVKTKPRRCTSLREKTTGVLTHRTTGWTWAMLAPWWTGGESRMTLMLLSRIAMVRKILIVSKEYNITALSSPLLCIICTFWNELTIDWKHYVFIWEISAFSESGNKQSKYKKFPVVRKACIFRWCEKETCRMWWLMLIREVKPPEITSRFLAMCHLDNEGVDGACLVEQRWEISSVFLGW